MKPLVFVSIFAGVGLAAGCAYRGAVYSEYNQVSLDVRANQASSAPVKVNFGYDRQMMAYIPKRNPTTNSIRGEAVSVISWNDIYTTLAPSKLGTSSVLRVEAGFIAGTAANVAAAPSNATVIITSPAGTNFVVNTQGSPGRRIATAFKPTARFVSADQAEMQELLDQIMAKPDPGRSALFEQAAKALPADFETIYASRISQGLPPRVAFLSAKNRYLGDELAEGPKHQRIIEALKSVVK